MKIRIKGNSVRLRLTKPEVEAFCTTGYFEERTPFPQGIFSYAIQKKDTIRNMEASFSDNRILVSVPENMVSDWSTNEEVGFQHNQFLSGDRVLSLLVEKDFVCLDETIEDQSDNYPNPLADKK